MLQRVVMTALMALLVPISACAQEEVEYQAGQHYAVLDKPVRTADPSKIEVVEVFWYGCHHCFNFEPMVKAWSKNIADDVDFKHSPAMWDRQGIMRLHAKAYYTAKALGVLETVHQPIFNALNVEGKKLLTEQEIAQLFADYGVDKEKFSKTFNSFGINSQVSQADARARSYRIGGTPEIVVNGKYRVTGRMADSQAGMLKVVDFLIEKERAALK